MPNFTFCGGREHKDNGFLFPFLTFDTEFKHLTTEIVANILRIERDGISTIKFQASIRFRSRRRRCCLSSLFSVTQRCNIILLRYCFEWLQHCSSLRIAPCNITFFSSIQGSMLEQCCSQVSKRCRNNVVTLCCAKNRRCKSPRVTSPTLRS